MIELDCLRKRIQCVKWVGECEQEYDHSIGRRDTRHATEATVHITSTNLTTSSRHQAHTLTFPVTGSAIAGMLLGMMTMFLILWRCDKRRRWKPSSFHHRTEESGILHPEVDGQWRDSNICRAVNENNSTKVERKFGSCEENAAESSVNGCSYIAEQEQDTRCSSYPDVEKNPTQTTHYKNGDESYNIPAQKSSL